MTWRVAESLLNVKERVQELRPDTVREKRMFGTIGDAQHATRDSDHNPWVKDSQGVGVVRALDVPLRVGEGNRKFADRIRRLAKGWRVAGVWMRKPHPAFGTRGYVISDGRIASAKSNWKWRPYNGSNRHDTHVHISVGTAEWRYDNTQRFRIRRRDVK